MNLDDDPRERPITLPVHLCTVKVSHKSKLRFQFDVISPDQSIQLQAASQMDMNHWLAVIQNSVSAELHAGAADKDHVRSIPGSPANRPKGKGSAEGEEEEDAKEGRSPPSHPFS